MAFIAFEGLDGSGKTTQIKRLGTYFAEKGIDCLVTGEPTRGPIGSLCRSALLGNTPLSQDAMALIFAADRTQHLTDEILPALEADKLVLCDRYIYSNMAFQGDLVSFEDIAAYNHLALRTPPDLTIFIDVQPEEVTRRISISRTCREIYDGYDIAHNIRSRYFNVFDLYGKTMPVSILDGNVSENELFMQLCEILLNFLGIHIAKRGNIR